MGYELLGFTPQTGQWRWRRQKAIEAAANYQAYLDKYASELSVLEYWRKTECRLRFIRRLPNGRGKNGGVQHWTPPSDTVIRTSNWTDLEVSEIHKDYQLPFDNPKSVKLMQELIRLVRTENDAIVLDFFAGSATTAEAIMRQNASDGKNRRFILVQLGEKINGRTDGFTTVAAIARTRLRLAGERLLSDIGNYVNRCDIGFRAFKMDSSNMKDTFYLPGEIRQADLFAMVDNIKPGRSSEDLLYQVMLDLGIDLTLPIVEISIMGKQVFQVGNRNLVVCFASGVSAEIIKALAQLRPERLVLRDDSFSSDAVKANVKQILRQLSPDTRVRVI